MEEAGGKPAAGNAQAVAKPWWGIRRAEVTGMVFILVMLAHSMVFYVADPEFLPVILVRLFSSLVVALLIVGFVERVAWRVEEASGTVEALPHE